MPAAAPLPLAEHWAGRDAMGRDYERPVETRAQAAAGQACSAWAAEPRGASPGSLPRPAMIGRA